MALTHWLLIGFLTGASAAGLTNSSGTFVYMLVWMSSYLEES